MLSTAAHHLRQVVPRRFPTRLPAGRAPHAFSTQIGHTRSLAMVPGSAAPAGPGSMSDAAKTACTLHGSTDEERVAVPPTERTSNASGTPQQSGSTVTAPDRVCPAQAESSGMAGMPCPADACVNAPPPQGNNIPHATPTAAAAAAAAAASLLGASHPAAKEGQALAHGAVSGRKRALDGGAAAPAAKKQEVAADYKKQWGPRPTHFLAVKVSQHPQVVQAFEQVQAALVEANPALKPTCIDPASAHITLFVLTLDEAKLQQALDVLQQLQQQQQQQAATAPEQHRQHTPQGAEEGGHEGHLHSSSSNHGAVASSGQQGGATTPQQLPAEEHAAHSSSQRGMDPTSCAAGSTRGGDQQPTAQPGEPQGHEEDPGVQPCPDAVSGTPWRRFEMDLRGLGHFNNKVLFLQVAPGAGLVQLHRLNDAVTAAFRAAGLYKEQEAFQPHATIAKMSKLYNKQRRTVGKRFPAAAYAGLGDMEGGRVAVEQVVLCRMQGRRQGMFYPVDGCVRLL